MTYRDEGWSAASEELSAAGQKLRHYADYEYEELLTAVNDAWRSDDAATFLAALVTVKEEMSRISEDISRAAEALKNMQIHI